MSKGGAQTKSSPRFKPYPAYKDSDIEWLGKIPVHWEVKKIKRLCLVRRGASPRPIEDPVYFDDEGEYAWVRIADVTASDRYLETTTQKLSELGKSKSVPLELGELFVSIAGTVGKPIITKIKCCIHDGFVYFIGLRENREYLYFVFSCGEPYKGLGKLGTQLNLNTDTIGDIYLPIPSSREQQEIVDGLDRETSKIDALVAKKERLIELLQEKRTAIITRAVTKGLDPTVPMKHSGIESLGEIPAHWEVISLKRIVSIRYGLGEPPQQLADGLPFIRATNVTKGRIVDREMQFVDPKDVPWNRDPILRSDDIIVVRSGAYTGDSAIIPATYDGAIAGYDMVVRSRRGWARFLAWTLLSRYVLEAQIELESMRAAQPHLNAEELGAVLLMLPPDSEQRAIAAYLDRETTKFDALVAKVRDGIDRLKEYRIALISAAVTGKIDVREETA